MALSTRWLSTLMAWRRMKLSWSSARRETTPSSSSASLQQQAGRAGRVGGWAGVWGVGCGGVKQVKEGGVGVGWCVCVEGGGGKVGQSGAS